ncbi:MAG TPA: lipopolysaccharide assembly protein LapA domain-containing protein [Corynebacterium xerosis]|uniref:LapA family protein n=1 Tax=Corynebacterium xerosis TaxID=1725 RepID=UPI001D44481B|nr:lipopolysaccharide assembly protein LapA domain-containing protein [Corynebacterium xerosis]HJG57863.1 lipopolysaccharide assembly protein LapA domain-containing protein [Corynebacterium xerosis]
MTERDYPDAAGRPVTGRDNAPLDGGADAYAAPRADVPARMDDTAVEPLPADPVDTTETPEPSRPAKKGGAASSTWVALIVGALLLILLLIFIMQNQQTVELHLFGWTWNFPLGVGLLLASIIGGLIMACAGIWKMFEMKRQLRRR